MMTKGLFLPENHINFANEMRDQALKSFFNPKSQSPSRDARRTLPRSPRWAPTSGAGRRTTSPGSSTRAAPTGSSRRRTGASTARRRPSAAGTASGRSPTWERASVSVDQFDPQFVQGVSSGLGSWVELTWILDVPLSCQASPEV